MGDALSVVGQSMGITELKRKHLPHLTPVVMLCLAFIAANASGPLIVFLQNMQAKSKDVGLDWFDFAITLVFLVGIVGSTVLAFMNGKYTKWADERAQKKQLTETEWAKQETVKAQEEVERRRQQLGKP